MLQSPDTSSGWQGTSGRRGPLSTTQTPAPSSAGTRGAPRTDVPRVPLEQYEIIDLLGKGGMGEVYLAYEPLMHRNIALKVLMSSAGGSELQSHVARFLAEAMLTGRLTHGGIIPIYQVGFDPNYGYHYSMRYVKGQTLQHVMKQRAAALTQGTDQGYSLVRLLEIFVRVCEAVAHAHTNGILHRDLKPSNVMITPSNEVLVLDWGLARDLHSHDPLDEVARRQTGEEILGRCKERHLHMTREFLLSARRSVGQRTPMPSAQDDEVQLPSDELTQSGILVGTPWYMSPEQISGDRVLTPASDVYSLGVILYRLLSGGMPVESRNLTELVSRVSHGDIKRIETRPEALRLPKALCDIVNRSLELEAAVRYQHAGHLADDLRLYLEGQTPLRRLVNVDFREADRREQDALGVNWEWDTPSGATDEDGIALTEGSMIRTRQRSLGDFRCTVGLRAKSSPWALGVLIGEKKDGKEFAFHHEIRLGVVDRAFAEIRWMDRRVQRRFDVRLQSGQYYELTIEVDEGHLRVLVDGSPVLNYRDIFPQTGGAVALASRAGTMVLQQFDWHTRGAPLNLSYQFLPDRFFLAGRLEEARELYNQMAESHPDREEGLMALYKAGLCSADLKDTQEAFGAFSRLENTMLDHYCTLGLARIGAIDGNYDWAWEALKSGYLRHHDADVRTEIWFALLNVVEQHTEEEYKERAKKYLELLNELEATPQELGQITYEYLDLIERRAGPKALRQESVRLLREHPDDVNVGGEALYSLWRTSLDEAAAEIAYESLTRLTNERNSGDHRFVRLLILKAELEIAQVHLDEALKLLHNALKLAEGTSRSERLWALNWKLLCRYLKGEYKEVLEEGRGALAMMDQYSADQLAYLLILVSLVQLRIDKNDRAREALTRASSCAGWWGRVCTHILEKGSPDGLSQGNSNLVSEALFLAGEVLLRMGESELGKEYMLACDRHPSKRVMTRRLALSRLRGLGMTTSLIQGDGLEPQATS